jgi:hypothetical protein
MAMELELVPKKKVNVQLEKWPGPIPVKPSANKSGYKPPVSHVCKTCPVTFHLTFE